MLPARWLGRPKATPTIPKITETCDCGYTASVTLSSADVYYDGAAHPARLRYTGTLLAAAPTIVYRVQAADGSYGAPPTGEAVPTSAGSYRASITVGGQHVTVEYQIKSPTAGTSMEAKIAAGQFFRDCNGGTSASAAQNDAFTVQFTVQKLNLDVYQQAPVLSFGAALPAGATVIM